MKLLFAFFALTIGAVSYAQSITVNISGIEKTEGNLSVAVFENQEQFDDEVPAKSIQFDKSDIVDGKKTVTLNLKPGTYAITVLDDEDKSGDMTYRFGVYPLEGVGFSNYILSGMSKPDFADFDFTVTDKKQDISVKMKYF